MNLLSSTAEPTRTLKTKHISPAMPKQLMQSVRRHRNRALHILLSSTETNPPLLLTVLKTRHLLRRSRLSLKYIHPMNLLSSTRVPTRTLKTRNLSIQMPKQLMQSDRRHSSRVSPSLPSSMVIIPLLRLMALKTRNLSRRSRLSST